jgi:hypothetical protein
LIFFLNSNYPSLATSSGNGNGSLNTSVGSVKSTSGNDNANSSGSKGNGSKPAAEAPQMNTPNSLAQIGQLPQLPGMPPMNLNDPSKIPPHMLPFLNLMANSPAGLPGLPNPGNPNQRQMTPQEL